MVNIVYTKHAEEMLAFRKISKRLIEECVKYPDKSLPSREGKEIHLKDFGKNYLRAIILREQSTIIVITVHWLAKKRLK